MSEDPPRTQKARAAAELALVRVVHHYGARPEFVVLGGLVPALLCASAPVAHAGTTDIDVQVDLEIAGGAVNTARLEQALQNADFSPDDERVWRWELRSDDVKAVVKFELLTDLDEYPAGATVGFADCRSLGAANLRGTGRAARDVEVRRLRAKDGGVLRDAEVYVTGLAGFLLAKVAAAHGRRKPKDWYDIAYVLLHNDAGGVDAAIQAVQQRFGSELGSISTQLTDLGANFHSVGDQGPEAYVDQMRLDLPDEDPSVLATDARLAVTRFCTVLLRPSAAGDSRSTAGLSPKQ